MKAKKQKQHHIKIEKDPKKKINKGEGNLRKKEQKANQRKGKQRKRKTKEK